MRGNMSSHNQDDPVNLLSLDGGGIRGVSELVMLDYIMRRVQVRAHLDELPKPCDYFDIIAGTSTGGLIAIMLGRLQMTTTKALETYDDVAGNIFSGSNRRGKGFKVPKFHEGPLVQTVQDMVRTFSDTDTMIHPAMRTRRGKAFVCAVEPDKLESAQRFRTYTFEDEADQWLKDCKIWEAARATTAATMFFKEMAITYDSVSKSFVDGALGYNNPVEELIDEAGHVLSRKRKLGAIVSLGTGTKPRGLRSTEDVGFLAIPYGASAAKTLKDIAVDPEPAHRRVRDRLKEYPDTYFRFNVPDGAAEIGLDDWQKMEKLKEMTREYLAQEEVKQEMENLVEVLLKKKQTTGLTIGHLALDKKNIPDDTRIARNLTPPSSRFVGRREILDRLDDHFTPRLGRHKPRREFLLCGMGGAGKTQIALKFAQRYAERFHYIFLVDAENAVTAAQSYRRIANEHMGQELGQDESMDRVMNWIARLSEEWLLIVDNSNPDLLRRIVPDVNKGNVLYTSRVRDLGLDLPPEAVAAVDDMTVDDAVSLLLRAAQRDATVPHNREEAAPLVTMLGCLALAVDQAGAYIHLQHVRFKKYQELFQQRRADILSDGRYKGADDRSRAVYATFDLSYQAIRDLADDSKDSDSGLVAVDALTLLDIICFYHNENIPVAIFAAAAPVAYYWKEANRRSHPLIDGTVCFSRLLSVDDSTKWICEPAEAAIRLLEDFSLINVDYDHSEISMHILVSSWAMDRMDIKRRMECAFLAKTLLCWATPQEYLSDMTPYTYLFRRKLFTHANALETYLDANRKWYTMYRHWDDTAESESDLRLGLLFREAGEYYSSEIAYGRALFLRKLEYGLDHPGTLDVYFDLVQLHQSHKQYTDAESLLLQLLERAERCAPVEVVAKRSEKRRIRLLSVRKRVLKGKGKVAQAPPSSDREEGGGVLPGNPTVASKPGSHWTPHDDVRFPVYQGYNERMICQILFSLVDIYMKQGNTLLGDAARHQAIHRIEQYLGKYDENDSHLQRLLDILRYELEEQQAEPTLEALDLEITTLKSRLNESLAKGDDQSDMTVVNLKHKLAMTLNRAGQHAEALPLYAAYAAGCRDNYGVDDLRTVEAFRRYGRKRYTGSDGYLPGEYYFRNLLRGVIQRRGRQAPETGPILFELGCAIFMQGRIDEGITLLEKALVLHQANPTYETKVAESRYADFLQRAREGTPEERRSLARAALRQYALEVDRLDDKVIDVYTLVRGWNWSRDGKSWPERAFFTPAELADESTTQSTRFPNLVRPAAKRRAMAQPVELLISADSDSGGEGPSRPRGG